MDSSGGVLKTPPDSTNSDLPVSSRERIGEPCPIGQSTNSVTNSPSQKSSLFRDPYLPDDDGTILTPEHAFIQYQTRSEDQSCQICGQPAVGFHHRAYVCEACKKFFMRHTAARFRSSETGSGASTDTVCPMGGQCRVEGPGRGKCPYCRYRKCLDLGMTLTPPGGDTGCDISQIPCRVCGGRSSGFHFGALTCEGCKGFFRRTVLSNVRLECLSNGDCPITPANRNMCKSCRYKRCLAVGMSKSSSRIGRQPNAIKYYCAREISQLSTTGGESDGMPSSSVSLSNGRGENGRRRTTSVSSDGDSSGHNVRIHRSPSSTTTMHGRPASLASTGSGEKISIHVLSSSVADQQFTDYTGGLPMDIHQLHTHHPVRDLSFKSECMATPLGSKVPMHLMAPDSSPKTSSTSGSSLPSSIGNTTHQLPTKKRSTHGGLELHGSNNNGNNGDGQRCQLSGLGFLNPDPVQRYGTVPASTSPGMPIFWEIGNNGANAGNADNNGQVRETVQRMQRDWYNPLNQLPSEGTSYYSRGRHSFSEVGGTPTELDAVSHAPALEYSLPNPSDASTHISSTTGIGDSGLYGDDIRRRSMFVEESMSETGKLLAPLAVHLPAEEAIDSTVHYHELGGRESTSSSSMVVPQQEQSESHHPTMKESARFRRFASSSSGTTGNGSSPLQPANISSQNSGPADSSNIYNIVPDLSVDRTTAISKTRSIVDHLTSSVLQFRQHQHQQPYRSHIEQSQSLAASSTVQQHMHVKAPSPPRSSTTSSYMNRHHRPFVEDVHSLGITGQHLTSQSTYPPSPSTSNPTLARDAAVTPGQYTSDAGSFGGKPVPSDNISWHPKHRYASSSSSGIGTSSDWDSSNGGGVFQSPPNASTVSDIYGAAMGLNGVGIGADGTNSKGLCSSEIVSTSAPWFAAAAAAAAVANVLLVASQAPSNSNSALDNTYSASAGSFDPTAETDYNESSSVRNPSKRRTTTTTSFAKRIKMTGGDSDYLSGVPSGSGRYDANSVLELAASAVSKCDADGVFRSLQLPSGGVDGVTGNNALTHAPTAAVAMRAAAAAAAAAAATAANIVLSNTRVRGLPEDFLQTHRSNVSSGFPIADLPQTAPSQSSGTSSPSPPEETFVPRSAPMLDSPSSIRSVKLPQARIPSYTPSIGSGLVASPCPPTLAPSSSSSSVAAAPTLATSARKENPNDIRPINLSAQEFSSEIRWAIKHMINERRKIRDNLPASRPAMSSLERVTDVWERMMEHFDLHSKFIVSFAKLIPGFSQLGITDKRQLVRNAMYPLMLLELSRDYVAGEKPQYNYFDFVEEERQVILRHFPTFSTITKHLLRSGEFLNRLNLDNRELTLVCAQELFKNRQDLVDPVATAHLHYLANRVLADHITKNGQSLEERLAVLHPLSSLMDELNMEHHEVLAQLQHDKPHLLFPNLYAEMFQLPEPGEQWCDPSEMHTPDGNSGNM